MDKYFDKIIAPLTKIEKLKSLLGLAVSLPEMRPCASNHGDQMNLTVNNKHKQHATTVLNTKP